MTPDEESRIKWFQVLGVSLRGKLASASSGGPGGAATRAPGGAPAPPADADEGEGHLPIKDPIDIPLERTKQLEADLKNTGKAVETAVQARRKMEQIASELKIDLDKPDSLAGDLQRKTAKLDPAIKLALQNSLEQIAAERDNMLRLSDDLQSAREELAAAIADHARVLKEVKVDSPEAKEKAGFWSTAGERIEHVWDAVNAITSVDYAQVANKVYKALAHAIAGTDQVKDTIKERITKIGELEDQVQDYGKTINDIIQRLNAGSVENVDRAHRKCQRALAAQRDASHTEKSAMQTADDALGRYLASGASAKTKGATPSPFMRVYEAVEDAYEASAAVQHLLITASLSTDKIQVYYNQFVPLGKLVMDGPQENTEPRPEGMMITGLNVSDMVIYEKNGKQYLYHHNRADLQEISRRLKNIKQVRGSLEKIEPIHATWQRAFNRALGPS